jgi:hypothetical protein
MYPSGLWPLKILMFALLVTHEIATYSSPWEKTGDGFCRRTWIYILRFSFPRRRRLLLQGCACLCGYENITAGSGNLKTQNLRTSDSGVSPNPHQRTSGFHERPGSFPAVIRFVQNNVTTHGHILTGFLTITVIYQNRIFAFLIIATINTMPREGLV